MTTRYASRRRMTSSCARATVVAAVMCAVSGDPACGNPWFRLGDLVRNVIGNLRADGERARQVRDLVPEDDAMPGDPDAGRDGADERTEP